ncbi:MAG: type 1 glutamine amidotransferase [Xenococcaceae cyanobacterium MO_207.B15]|nr:type 1 glutamine amidotransferase [Xenococcaceae cyanobacterium MO_207.B15]
MKFLVIKHLVVEGLGSFAEFFEQADIAVDIVELEKGDPFPESLEDYSALWVMGGSMNVADENEYSWLREEKQLIREAARDLKLPYMGICLGAQLLADALGGTVAPMTKPEVGLLPIHLREVGRNHPLTAGLSESFKVLQWHGQEITQLPQNTTILASSDHCQVQAYAFGDRAFGLQFHSEVTDVTVEDWSKIPSYRADLEVTLGQTGCEDLKQAVDARLPIMNREARILWQNFLNIIKNSQIAHC